MRRNYKVKFIPTPTTILQHNPRAIHVFFSCSHAFQCSMTAENRLLHLQPFMNSHFHIFITAECVEKGEMLQLWYYAAK